MAQRAQIISKIKSGVIWKTRKIQKNAAGCINENAARASFEADQLIVRTANVHTEAEELTGFLQIGR